MMASIGLLFGIDSNNNLVHSYAPQANMTVTVTSERRGETLVAQRWGPARKVTIQRNPGAALGVSIVGGKVGRFWGVRGTF